MANPTTTDTDASDNGRASKRASTDVPPDIMLDIFEDLHKIAKVCTNPFAHPGAASIQWSQLAEKLELVLSVAGRIKPEE